MRRAHEKKRYARPCVKTQVVERPAVLLLCTGYPYNCIDDIGYDCCVTAPEECYTVC